ncbi:hypothetical protein STRIP9103_00642 [Streptomyces ipomoeae 91-03]|jgi:hypothetical protein|uniref:Uncharacterized protein n=1 Tax=Streptomyces ipomoeae 91-03 TaxID=698759 RepID=L1L0G7_9ACTN|nr:hypothetical protein STRIP9103_00642 [Streptomyces ipomoeae 91-03]
MRLRRLTELDRSHALGCAGELPAVTAVAGGGHAVMFV